MTALPKHKHLPKGPKITRISHQYIKNRGKTSKPLAEETKEQPSQPQSQQPQTNQRGGSYGYAPAQQTQQPVQPFQPINQQNPVPGWWMALVIVILAIFAFIFFFNLAKALFPDIGTGTGTGSNCLTSCEGYVVVQAPGCDCPSGSHLSPTTPYAYNNAECKGGCKQCICN